jgi:hypothetical protein
MRWFALLLALFFFALHALFYRRVLLRLDMGDTIKKRLSFLVWVNYLGVIGYIVGRYMADLPRWLYFLFSLSVGIGFLLLLGWLVYEVLHILHRFTPLGKLKKVTDALFLLAGAAVVVAAVYGGLQPPVVNQVTIDQHRFGGKAYRIVQISDMHVGGLVGRAFVQRCVSRINALHPDLVVITGDLTDMSVEKIADALQPLAKLKSRFGTYFVPGNHEYFHGIDETLAYLPKLGIKVLGNDAVKIDDAFWLAGVYDLMGRRLGRYAPDIEAVRRRMTHRYCCSPTNRVSSNRWGRSSPLWCSAATPTAGRSGPSDTW